MTADSSATYSPWFAAHYFHAAGRIREWLEGAPGFGEIPAGGRILDFGCGGGITTLSLASSYPQAQVQGIDVVKNFGALQEIADAELGLDALPENLELRVVEPDEVLTRSIQANCVVSWSVFEHIPVGSLEDRLSQLYQLLAPPGLFFLQIEPLYFSPFGSHLSKFVKQPWAHLLYSHAELIAHVEEAADLSSDTEKGHNYQRMPLDRFKQFLLQEYSHLNRVTADQMVGFVKGAGFELIREERKTLSMPVPKALSDLYEESALRTNALFLLARKPS